MSSGKQTRMALFLFSFKSDSAELSQTPIWIIWAAWYTLTTSKWGRKWMLKEFLWVLWWLWVVTQRWEERTGFSVRRENTGRHQRDWWEEVRITYLSSFLGHFPQIYQKTWPLLFSFLFHLHSESQRPHLSPYPQAAYVQHPDIEGRRKRWAVPAMRRKWAGSSWSARKELWHWAKEAERAWSWYCFFPSPLRRWRWTDLKVKLLNAVEPFLSCCCSEMVTRNILSFLAQNNKL